MFFKFDKQRHTLFAAVLILGFVAPATGWSDGHEKETAHQQANDADDENRDGHRSFQIRKTGDFHFLGGIGFLDFDGLNDRLNNAGYSKLHNPSMTLGFGGSMRFGRFMTGLEGHWLKNVSGEASSDDFRADYSGGYGLFRAGFDVLDLAGFRIHPLVGIGWGWLEIDIEEEQGASFNDVLADPGRGIQMTQDGLLLEAGLGADYRFEISGDENRSRFFKIGVRGGYLFAPYSGDWKTGSAEISAGPDIGLSGPTVQLVLGFSTEYKRHPHTRAKRIEPDNGKGQ